MNDAVDFACGYLSARQLAGFRRRHVRGAVRGPKAELLLFTDDEVLHLRAALGLMVRYVARADPSRPLCLAVFGPPGSGKTFTVEQLRDALTLDPSADQLKLAWYPLNMTQVGDQLEVAKVVAAAAAEQKQDTHMLPFFFFDEFDAPRDGAPYGWLPWFLAPMQDGEVAHDGQTISLKRAIMVFAGGTATTMEEFSAPRTGPEFRSAKGPDFISRLRGYIDVQGPNADPRELRRSVVLRKELAKRFSGEVSDEFVEALLMVGRFRHGARSISAIVDLTDLATGRFDWSSLPEDHLLEQHVDRGPLDPRRIGGPIAFTGYPNGGEYGPISSCWRAVADELGRHGAALADTGVWDGAMGGVDARSAGMVHWAGAQPTALRRDAATRADLRLVTYPRGVAAAAHLEALYRLALPFGHHDDELAAHGISLRSEEYLASEERERWARPAWLAGVVERFRCHLATCTETVALFAIGGVRAGDDERFPGLAEHVMLMLAMGKPVYIAGGLGGIASSVGSLLGMTPTPTGSWTGIAPGRTVVPTVLDRVRDELRPGPWVELPIGHEELGSFLRRHALGGPRWPDNGLDPLENRRLFQATSGTEIADLVQEGLRRRFRASSGE